MTYYDDTAKDYAERAEAAAENASQSKQQALTAAATATTQANIAVNAAENAATLVKSDLEAAVGQMKQDALSAAAQASNNASAAAASAVKSTQDAIDADVARRAAEAALSATNTSKDAAALSAANAATSETNAANSASDAADSETAAKASEDASAISETNAANSATDAHNSEVAAATSEENAEDSAKLSESWAVGGTGVRDGEDTNNAKYYADMARDFSPVSKADKVTGGDTDGMVAGLDSEGNLTNSGIPVENTAQKDGYYEDMTVGRAENLIDPNAPATRRKFGFDTACGDISITDNGNAIIKAMYGTTYVMNQLVPDEPGEHQVLIVKNHKYLYRNAAGEDSLLTQSTNGWRTVLGGQEKIIDLSIWFNFSATLSSIEIFYKLFPMLKGYNMPYNEGKILTYRGTGIRTIGFNAYNHATGNAVLLGGHKYQICGTYTSVSYVDQWGNTEELELDDKGIFTPANNGTLIVVGGNATDTCVHLCWSGYKNFGEPDYTWEPYTENTRSFDITPYFPSGVNQVSQAKDEILVDHCITRCGVHVFDGTETLGTYGQVVTWTTTGAQKMHPGYMQAYKATMNVMHNDIDYAAYNQPYVHFGGGGSYAYQIWFKPPNNFTGTRLEWIRNYLTTRYNAGNPVVVVYELETPVVTTFDQPLNLTYPVNDFGTEQSLPVNTATLLSADLDADIQYSIDFTRTVQHYSEIEKDVEGLVAEKDNLARQDGDYATKGLGAKTAQQLVDPNAPATEREFGFDTAAGNITISDNGTGVIDKLEGTTHVANQLVHDTNMNTKSSTDGKLALTDAVGGNLGKLEIHGGCVVHNQLVKESIAKTVTGTGRLGCSDGVAGNAESFVMTAPRSVVLNQLVRNGDFSDGTTGWTVYAYTGTVSDNTLTCEVSSGSNLHCNVNKSFNITAGHVYIVKAVIKSSVAFQDDTKYAILTGGSPSTSPFVRFNNAKVNTFVSYSVVFTAQATESRTMYFGVVNGTVSQDVQLNYKDIQLVDLTQYFNGNTTLINSISTWDDLVAYDPSFAQYVTYNTGTVKGVQPTVKVNHATDVACPVELFGVSDTVGDSFDGVSGVYTKNCYKITLTGNEAWVVALNSYIKSDACDAFVNVNEMLSQANSKCVGVCSHLTLRTVNIWGNRGYPDTFTINDIQLHLNISNIRLGITDYTQETTTTVKEKIKAYLQTQYNAGTPVVVVVPRATPTTTQYNGTTIPTVDIYNSAVQTSNERLASLSMTYQGREQTITLDPTHTYVFNDNQTEYSVITNTSTLDVVGGEDMLVDVTQFYNGDSARISQIQRWASLSTRFHRYRDLMPYNPGTVEPDTPVVRNYPDEYAYGVVYDPNQSSPACVKVELRNGVVSEVTDFSSMPCHQLYRCVMDDLANRHIAYYLDNEDSNKKYNGTHNGVTSDGSASVLTGADGDVMVEIPISYWYLDEDWNGEGKVLWLISDRPFMGTHGPAEIHDFFYVSPDGATCRTQYVGAYKASICNADGTPINTTEGALAQSTGTASTNIARSIAGALPYVNVNQNDLLTRAKRNNASTVSTQFHQWLFILMMVEQGSLNTQLISQGYSNGIQNAFCFWRKSGRVNAGNGTAEIFADENSQDMDNFQSLKVGSTTVQRDTLMDADGRYAWSIYNRGASSTRYFTDSPTPVNGDTVYSASTGDTTAGTVASYTIKAASARVIQWQYRGIENPFGEVWEFEHGIQKYSHAFMASIKYSNVVYYRDPAKYGVNSIAWTTVDGTTTIWSAKSTTSPVFSDENLTTQLGTASVNSYRYDILGYWETLSTTAYTGTEQQAAANPSYTWRRHRWPMASGWIKKFDPRTFFNMVNGGSGSTYLPDYYYDNAGTGSRVVYVGGLVSSGLNGGVAYRYVYHGLTYAYVYISGRLSA